jgi:C-terminal processing protease CtpA/Prc
VQVWAPLENDGGVRITISRWFTPQHHSVHPDGVQPDVVVDIPDGTPPERDLVLERAVQYLSHRGVGNRTQPSPVPSSASGSPNASGQTSYDTDGLTQSAA